MRGLRSKRSPAEPAGGDEPGGSDVRSGTAGFQRSVRQPGGFAERGRPGQAGARDGRDAAADRSATLRLFAAGGSTVIGLAGLATVGLLAGGCSAGGTGMRDEGPAAPAPVERSLPSPSPPQAPLQSNVDPVALIKADPTVSKRVKDELKPCSEGSYPVNTSYGDLTGGTQPDVVVNVMSCKESIGIGTYVYRPAVDPAPSSSASGARSDQHKSPGKGSKAGGAAGENPTATPTLDAKPVRTPQGSYVNVFTSEEPAVYATIDRGELVVTEQVYAKGDTVAYPSGEDVVTYGWDRSTLKFTERYRVRNDYSRSAGSDGLEGPAATAPAMN